MGFRELRRRILFRLQRNRHRRDLDEEMRLHVELRADQLAAGGLPNEKACRAAKLQFGNRTSLQETAAEVWSFNTFDQTVRDLVLAARFLAKNPSFALAAILSLALGLGVNTAIFSLLNTLSFTPLPVAQPQQLSRVGLLENNGMTLPIPGAMLDDLRKDSLLNGVCGFSAGDAVVESNGQSRALATHNLSGDCYRTLGVHAAIGRLFTLADDIRDGPKVAVLGYNFWKSHFNANPDVIGRSLRIGGQSFQIVGVTEPSFHGLLWGFPPSVSTPISQTTKPSINDPDGRFYWAETLVRRRPGVRQSDLQADLRVKWHRLLDKALPMHFNGANRHEFLAMPPVVTSGATGIDYSFRDRFQSSLVALLAISFLVLLISCINVANLLLARGWQRQRDIAVRLALGAARGRIVRQLLAESTILIFFGLLGASLLSYLGLKLIVSLFTSAYARPDLSFAVHLDARVWIFTACLVALAVLIFGVLPAWQTSDVNSAAALRASSRSITGGLTTSRRLLLAGQVAITLVILAATGLFSGSLTHLNRTSLNIAGDNVLNAQLMPLPGGELDGSQAVSYFRSLIEQVKTLPGVNAVSMASFAPLVSQPYKEDIRRLDRPDHASLQAPAEFVTEDFLRIMHIPLLQGRGFPPVLPGRAQKTAIVSISVARRLFPNGHAIGRHIQFGTEPETRDLEIIGVAADAHLEDPHTRDPGFILLNLWQLPRMGNWGNLQVRFDGSPQTVAQSVRAVMQNSSHQRVFLLHTTSELLDMSLLQERLLAATGKVYSVLAIILAAVGLFGLLTFLVARREGEFAIRLALGANRRDIASLVTKDAALLIGYGSAAGLILSFAVVRILSALLGGVARMPLTSVALSIGILIAVAALAALGPVCRAAALDANAALRQQ